jgi:hypothetical protein
LSPAPSVHEVKNHETKRETKRPPVRRERGGEGMTEHSVEEIPLYLVPHVLKQEIHRLGEGVAEVRIRRTGRHFYHILIRTGRGDAA